MDETWTDARVTTTLNRLYAAANGWKDLYLPMLRMLRPKELALYVAFVRDPPNGFTSTALPLGHGLEFSVHVA